MAELVPQSTECNMKDLIPFISTLFLAIRFFMPSAYAIDVLKFKANYQIPTTQLEDPAHGLYKLEDYVVVQDGNKATLSYLLPFAMTGVLNQLVSLELVLEDLPLRVFRGEKATSLCKGKWSEMKCQVRFHQIEMDLSLLELFFISEGYSEDETAKRMAILQRFNGEPLGFSEVTK
jgi:hypothetical protein